MGESKRRAERRTPVERLADELSRDLANRGGLWNTENARAFAAAMAPPAPDDIVALVQVALDDSLACGEHTTNDAESYATAFICAEASHAALLAAIGRMGGAAVPLADAMWQLLDDMGADGLSVCPAAKAAARLAYEPFADVDAPLAYTVADARAVALSSTATEPSSGALPEATAADGLMGRLGRLPIVDLGIAWPDRSPPKDPSTHTEPSPDALCKAGGRLCSTHQQRAYLRHYANEQPIGSGPWTLLLVVLNDLEATLTGVDGAAKQASLCDLIEPAKRLRSERDAAEARAQAAEAEAGRLREAFQDLESTASRVAWFGPITGPHWPPLSTALVKARAALAPQGSEAAEQGDRG